MFAGNMGFLQYMILKASYLRIFEGNQATVVLFGGKIKGYRGVFLACRVRGVVSFVGIWEFRQRVSRIASP